MTEVEAKSSLREWIIKKTNGRVSTIENDTLLLEEKIISSLQIMDLVLFVERLSGKKPTLAALKPESFRTVDSIYAAFF